jgi:protein TonB
MIKKTLILFLCFITLVCQAQQEKKKIVFKVRKHLIKEEVVIATGENTAIATQEIRIEEKKDEVIENTAYATEGNISVEESATFQGGDLSTFQSWVEKNVSYPASIKKFEISGKVNIEFYVNSQGKVVNARILRGRNDLEFTQASKGKDVDAKIKRETRKTIENELLRVVSSSPDWFPAKNNGKAVKQLFTITLKVDLK